MRDTAKSPFSMLLTGCAAAWLACGTASAATFSLAPGSVATGSTNEIVLSVDGLVTQQPVLIEEFRDANGNGTIDPGENLVLSFTVADGEVAPFIPAPGEGHAGDD